MRLIKFTVGFHAKVESFLFKQNAGYPSRDRGLRILRNIQNGVYYRLFSSRFDRLQIPCGNVLMRITTCTTKFEGNENNIYSSYPSKNVYVN